jgi:hypothetical protein
VRRGAAAWLVSVPVALAGCLAAHSLAYRLVEPDAHERAHLLASSGHGYVGHWRLLLAGAVALVLVGFVRQAIAAARGLEPGGPPRLVALVPPLAFVLQEHLERAFHDDAFPLEALTQPSFAVGLALQVPFALLAVALARLLAHGAEALGRLLATKPRVAARRAADGLSPFVPTSAPRIAGRGRAPPLLARP